MLRRITRSLMCWSHDQNYACVW